MEWLSTVAEGPAATSLVFQTWGLTFGCLTVWAHHWDSWQSFTQLGESGPALVFLEAVCLFVPCLPPFCKCFLKWTGLVLASPVLGTKQAILKRSLGWHVLPLDRFPSCASKKRRGLGWLTCPLPPSCPAISNRIALNVGGYFHIIIKTRAHTVEFGFRKAILMFSKT